MFDRSYGSTRNYYDIDNVDTFRLFLKVMGMTEEGYNKAFKDYVSKSRYSMDRLKKMQCAEGVELTTELFETFEDTAFETKEALIYDTSENKYVNPLLFDYSYMSKTEQGG